MKPATPLPWSIMVGTNGHANFITNMLGHNDPLAHIECHNNTRKGRERDCLYTLHACNAYPRLVEALRGCAEDHQMLLKRLDGSFHMTGQTAVHLLQTTTDEANALLRELGEEKPQVSAQKLSDFGRADPIGESIFSGRTSSKGNP